MSLAAREMTYNPYHIVLEPKSYAATVIQKMAILDTFKLSSTMHYILQNFV